MTNSCRSVSRFVIPGLALLGMFASTLPVAAQTTVTLQVGDGSGEPGTGGHAVLISLTNAVPVKGIQMNLYDVPDDLDMIACNTTGRTGA